MKFIISGPFKDNIYNLMRQAGYSFEGRKKTDSTELIYARPDRGYPRFHIYMKLINGNWLIDLHLDQKKPSYKGSTAHSGEYTGQIVEKEAERIKQSLQ